MDATLLTFDASNLPLVKLTEQIKRVRAAMRGDWVVFVHRDLCPYRPQVMTCHTSARDCICSPVILTYNDWRPSVYFANEILYPTIH